MANLFDYLDWRGDLPFSAAPLNPVDGILLARLSYLPFELFSRPLGREAAPLWEVAAELSARADFSSRVLRRSDARLLTAMGQSVRFREMTVFHYEQQFDPETQTQFSAVSIGLGDGRTYLSFRGTDNTLVGWKEDFNMAFTCPVPAQRSALAYLEAVAGEVSGPLLLGGHSKGGNLAVYAAAFCPPALEERILAAYNFDGPGFDESVLQTEGYRRVCHKVSTFVPQSSIVGMLLGHEEKYTIVHSTQTNGILQHSVYTWEVLRDRFSQLETVTSSSRFIDFTLKEWISRMDSHQREAFIDTMYAILTQNNAKTLGELSESPFSTARLVLTSVRHLDEPTRKAVTGAMVALIRSTKSGLLQILQLQKQTAEQTAKQTSRRTAKRAPRQTAKHTLPFTQRSGQKHTDQHS